MYLEHPEDELTRSAMQVWIQLAASKAIRVFSGAIRLFITTNPFLMCPHVILLSAGPTQTCAAWEWVWAWILDLLCPCRSSFCIRFASTLYFDRLFYARSLEQLWKSTQQISKLFLVQHQSEFLFICNIYVCMVQNHCSLESKMAFRRILPICHFSQPAELLPLLPLGFRSLTMHQKCPGKRSAFVTDLWSWFKQQGSQYTLG